MKCGNAIVIKKRLLLALYSLLYAVLHAGYLSAEDVYMTKVEAMQFAFNGNGYKEFDLHLNDAQIDAMKDTLKRNDIGNHHKVYYSLNSEKPGRYALIVNEVGKYRNITFIVVLDKNLRVDDIAVMVYREPIGDDVRRPWWLKQFEGKNSSDPVKRNIDIINISGATLSADAICKGIRKALAVVSIAAEQLNDGGVQELRRQYHVMGTLLTITLVGNSKQKLSDYAQRSYEIAKDVDSFLSNFDEESQISRLNKLAGVTPVKVDEKVFDFLEKSNEFSRQTGGAYDITIGPAVKEWGFYSKDFRVPEDSKIEQLKKYVGFKHLKTYAENRSAFLVIPGMYVDTGAAGKGFCLSLILEYLKRQVGIERALLDFGSSQYGFVNEGDKGWEIRVKHPLTDQDALPQKIFLNNKAISTSGASEKFFEKGREKYHHILDPSTCRPARGLLQVTLVGDDPFMLDAFSTAAFVMGKERGIELASRHNLKYIIVDNSGKIYSNLE